MNILIMGIDCHLILVAEFYEAYRNSIICPKYSIRIFPIGCAQINFLLLAVKIFIAHDFHSNIMCVYLYTYI